MLFVQIIFCIPLFQILLSPKIKNTFFSLNLNFSDIPELFVYYQDETRIEPGGRLKISIFFRPKQVKLYEFKLHFWVNSLCEEIVTIKGEGTLRSDHVAKWFTDLREASGSWVRSRGDKLMFRLVRHRRLSETHTEMCLFHAPLGVMRIHFFPRGFIPKIENN